MAELNDIKVNVGGDEEFNAKCESLIRALNTNSGQHAERMRLLRADIAANIFLGLVWLAWITVTIWSKM